MFDLTNVETSSDYDLIPNGIYQMVIEECDWRNSKKNPQNEYLNMRMRITGDKQNNRVVFGMLNLINTNATATNIALTELKTILSAVGETNLKLEKDSVIGAIIDKPFLGKLGVQKGSGDFPDKNVVKDYLPLDEKNKPFTTDASSPF